MSTSDKSDYSPAERAELLREKERLGAAMNALKAVRPIIAGLISAEYNVETWGLKGRLAAIDAALMPNEICEVCGGDCSAANPPPTYCPERDGSGPNLADAHTKSLESTIAKQAEVLKEMEAALRPFGEIAAAVFHRYETVPGAFREAHQDDPDDRPIYGFSGTTMTVGHLRRARALTEGGAEHG